MNFENELYKKIETSKFDLLVRYGTVCSLRIVNIYKLFDNLFVDEQDETYTGNGFEQLSSIINTISSKNDILTDVELESYLVTCQRLAPDSEEYGGLESDLANYVANTIEYFVQYCISKSAKDMIELTTCFLEVINIVESEKFYLNAPDGDADTILEIKFEEEYKFLMESLDILTNTDDLNSIVEEKRIVLE